MNTLNKKIKKSLIEVKEKKEKRLIEESLIKNRFYTLLEGIECEKDFKSLSDKKQFNLSVKFIQEMSYLNSVGFINEEQDNLKDILTKMFGKSFNSIAETMVEPFVKNMLLGLEFKEGFVKNFLVSYLTSKPSEIIRGFNDCRIISKLISEGIVESMVISTQKKENYNGFGYDLMRNELGGMLKSFEFIKKIEQGVEGKVCSIIDNLIKNTKSVVEKLKPVMNNID